MRDRRDHWEGVYRRRAPDEVSWYQPRPDRSLDLIRATNVPREAALIDVGAGASRLVDALIRDGYSDLSVLDISGAALAQVRDRLGADAARVEWHETDIVDFQPRRKYALWHDRAVFHFLTERSDRKRYVEVMCAALALDGQAIISTFAPDGPPRCSGLDVVRYGADEMLAALGHAFALEETEREAHQTPAGGVQNFAYFRLSRRPGPANGSAD